MFLWILPIPAIILVMQCSSLSVSNTWESSCCIRRQRFNWLEITKCSIQGHHFDYTFPQRSFPVNVGSKMWSSFLLHVDFLFFFPLKVYLKRVKHSENPRINHHKYSPRKICLEVSSILSHILKSTNEILRTAWRSGTNEYIYFTKQYRPTSTDNS